MDISLESIRVGDYVWNTYIQRIGKVVKIGVCDCVDNGGDFFLVTADYGLDMAITYHNFNLHKLESYEHESI